MMGIFLLLGGLFDVWFEVVVCDEFIIVFEVCNGWGWFLFMMFFDLDDKVINDCLFVFL